MSDEIWILRDNNPADREARDYDKYDVSSLPHYELPKSEALNLILGGNACFAAPPCSPPFELLDVLDERLGAGLEVLGPSISDPKLAARIAKELLPNGIRQTHIDGNPILWRNHFFGLRWLIGDAISGCPDCPSNLFAEARWILCGPGIDTPRGSDATVAVDDESLLGGDEQRRFSRTVPLSKFELIAGRGTHRSSNGSEKWDTFGVRLQKQLNRSEMLVQEALVKGKVIVAHDKPSGSVFVAPKVAGSIEDLSLGSEFAFALAGDLPQSLLKPDRPLEARRRSAARFLERADHHFAASNRFFSQSVAIAVLEKRFGLTENAARDSIKLAKLSRKMKPGNYPEDQKVSVEELLKFNV